MNSPVEEQHSLKRPQFSLSFLLFVVPTIAGLLFAGYSAFSGQARRHADLQVEHAMLLNEYAEAKVRKGRLDRLNQTLEQKQKEWNSPERILAGVEAVPPSIPGLARPLRFAQLPNIGDSIHFYLQASDAQLHALVEALIQRYPGAHVTVQFRILDCLSNLPSYVTRERLEGVKPKIRAFVEPLQQDPHAKIQAQASEVLRAFELPLQPPEEE